MTVREEELVRRVEEDNILQWREEVSYIGKPPALYIALYKRRSDK